MKYIWISFLILCFIGIVYWLSSGKYYTDQSKPKKSFKIKFPSKDAVFGILGAIFIGLLFAAMMIVPLKMHQNELNEKRVWLNEEHTACHYQDTIIINGQKYIHVYDHNNSGFYGDPYLLPVN